MDLYVRDEWTRRFTELADKHIDLSDAQNLVYLNAGTGTHALALDEKYGAKVDIFASCENEHMLTIARDKAAAVSSKVDFSNITFDDDAFDAVLADASFVEPYAISDFIGNAVRIARQGGEVAVFLPSAGTFGEVFSLLWEVLFNEDLGEHGQAAERMISEIPTITALEETAKSAGLVNVQSETVREVFEFENGQEFVASPLVADFLMPRWLETLEADDRERVTTKLSELIDAEDGSLSFRFSVKATLLTGEKG